MRIALTGASGFIGQHVLAELLQRDVTIVLLQRDLNNDLPNCDQVERVILDIQNAPNNNFERLGRPDALLHLAWGGLPNYSSQHHLSQELPAHYALLSKMVCDGLPRLLVAGTCLEYGMLGGKLTEELEVTPDTAYGKAKDSLRRQLQDLQATKDYQLVWTRIFYTYGTGQNHNTLFQQLRAAAESGQSSFDLSSGMQLRDYLPVTEVSKALVTLSLANNNQGVVNICSGHPIAIRELVEGWVKEYNWPLKLNFGILPNRSYEAPEAWGDRSKLDQVLCPGARG